MKAIQISTDVFAKIWAHRLPGEETEDAVLRRILAVREPAASVARKKGSEQTKRILWRDDVRTALERLGGSAHLTVIYEKVREIRRAAGRKMPTSLEAIVRRELEYNSSDSESFTGKLDWFQSALGLGHGVWKLRIEVALSR